MLGRSTAKAQTRIRDYFISGFFALIPIGLSLGVVLWFMRLVDDSLAPVLDSTLGWRVPGLGLVAAAAGIFAAGVITSHVAGERLMGLAEDVLMRVPVFKWVYGTVKQMTEAFSPDNKAAFKSVVLIEYPRPGMQRLAFVTRELTVQHGKGERVMVSAYVPTNHLYIGDVVLVPKDEVVHTQLGVQAGIQAVLSGGVSLPAHLSEKKG